MYNSDICVIPGQPGEYLGWELSCKMINIFLWYVLARLTLVPRFCLGCGFDYIFLDDRRLYVYSQLQYFSGNFVILILRAFILNKMSPPTCHQSQC